MISIFVKSVYPLLPHFQIAGSKVPLVPKKTMWMKGERSKSENQGNQLFTTGLQEKASNVPFPKWCTVVRQGLSGLMNPITYFSVRENRGMLLTNQIDIGVCCRKEN